MVYYIDKYKLVYETKIIKNKKEAIILKRKNNYYQVNNDIYVNLEAIKEINYVENYIVFNNGMILKKLLKKINF